MSEGIMSVEATRRIMAPAARLFEILANPQRHADFDGSDMLRGATSNRLISGVGDTFTMKMHRLGRDYIMVNHVVVYEQDRRIAWEPAPGDVATAGGDPARVGVPAGYRWGYSLTPVGETVTVVTESFDCGNEDGKWILLKEDGRWINGSNTVVESMADSLERLERISTE